MTKEQFINICNKANVKGNAYDHGIKCLWVPEKNWFIRIMYDTSGSQLLPEDYDEGYNDYIDYQISEFTDSDETLFKGGDGGIWLFNNEENCDVQEQTWDMLSEGIFYNEEVPDVMWIEINNDFV